MRQKNVMRKIRQEVFGFTLLEVVIYTALLAMISVLALDAILSVSAAFGRSRTQRNVTEQGSAVLERMVREVRLASEADVAESTFDVHPGELALNTMVSASDSTPITRRFFLSTTTLMMQEGINPAIPLTAGVKVTKLIFHNFRAPTIYYVRGSYGGCSDTGPGTATSTPFCTVTKAAAVVIPGDVVYVGAATYNGTVRPAKTGASGAPIIFIGDNTGAKTTDAGPVIVQGNAQPAFDLYERSYITVIGFTIKNSTGGVFFSNSATASSTNITVESNTFTNVSSDSTHLAAIDNSDATDQATNKNHLIRYNLMYNNTARAIALDRGSNILVEHNIMYSNGTDNMQIVATKGMIRDNIIYKSNTPREGIDITGRNGITTDLDIVNNTFYQNRHGIEITGGTGPITVDIIDNIFKDNTQNGILVSNTSSVTCRYSYNIFHNDAVVSCTDQGNNIVNSDPKFVDADGADNILGGANGTDDKFHLDFGGAGSPAINAGSQSVEAAGLETRTTRTDNALDSGTVDLGYHYVVNPYINPSFTGSATSTAKTIRIEMTMEDGTGRSRTVKNYYGAAVPRGSY